MTSAKVKLALGQPQHARLKYLDIVSGSYGLQLRAKGTFEGIDAVAYLPGDLEDGLATLKAAGVVTDIPLARPDDLHPAVEVRLAARDVVLAVEKPGPKAPARLVVTRNGAPTVAVAATLASGAGAPSGPAAARASDSVEARREALVASFQSALEMTVARLVPVLAARGEHVDSDVTFRVAFSLWRAWLDAGLA